MPRMTKKWKGALDIVKSPGELTQEQVYEKLNNEDYFWDSKKQSWERAMSAETSSPFLKIRVWENKNTVDESADVIVSALEKLGVKLVERSKPYLCRPPQQSEARVYLTFMRA